ncbi:prenyltransferase [Arsenicicoccus bolidensis]|uniref:prenyltransferase n=1 Tax=Arsenicicoccus bolidensis TaxID=229480 RepID=UPI0028A5AC56|nr:prenyltransferase [Arsenicicoccus bolidensis]
MSQQSQQSRLGRLVASSRPLSWVNTAYPFGAAYLLTAGRLDLRAVVGIVFFLVPYNLLMYGVNDVFDYESDLRNPRKGGVEGIVLDRSLHRLTLWAAVLLPVPFGLWLLAHGSLAAGIVLAVSVAAVVAYSAPGLRFKERAFVDSMTSSTHFVSPAVYGVVLAGVALPWQGWVVLLAYFLWGMASHAFGAVQDVTADRAAGIGSVATVIGAQATVRLSARLYAATGLLLATTGRWGLLAALLVLPYLWMVWPYRSLSDEEAPRANGGWRRFLWINYVVGFLLTQLLIARWLVG